MQHYFNWFNYNYTGADADLYHFAETQGTIVVYAQAKDTTGGTADMTLGLLMQIGSHVYKANGSSWN